MWWLGFCWGYLTATTVVAIIAYIVILWVPACRRRWTTRSRGKPNGAARIGDT